MEQGAREAMVEHAVQEAMAEHAGGIDISLQWNVCNDPEHTINSLATALQLHSKSLATTQNMI